LTFRRWSRAAGFATPYRKAVGVLSAITVVVSGIGVAEPLLLKYIFDSLGRAASWQPLMLGVAGLAGLGLLREAANSFSNWLTWKTRIGIHYALLQAMVDRLHRVALSFHRKEGVGAIMTKLDRGIQGFLNAVTEILFHVFPAVLYLVIAIAVMVQLNAKLALLVLCFAPLPAVVGLLAAPEQSRRERSLFERYVRIYSRFNEVLAGLRTVRSFAMEEREKRRFLEDVNEANAVVIRGVRRDSVSGGATSVIVMTARLAAIGLGGALLIRGEVTIGTVMAFLGFIGSLFGPVQGLTGIYQTMRRASVALDEIFSILDLREHLADRPDAREPSAIRGDVCFEDVHFAYEHTERSLLRGIDLEIRAGEMVAIVGPSGSGKTTLLSLLMRFEEPTQGVIRLDGIDLRELHQAGLRAKIGVVLQEPLLFNDTVRNNIAYGRRDATPEEIVAAARAANAHDFIMRLPEGYETVLGEGGGRLSVGERQRITIARALVKDPPLILLDEATCSLDAESEATVQEALERLMAGRTTLVVAHRLATVVNADRIIVLKEGRIVESGTHPELMRQEGYYQSLVRRQTHRLLVNDGETQGSEAAPVRLLEQTSVPVLKQVA
jgi:ATP-binding cassette subfamily B protein